MLRALILAGLIAGAASSVAAQEAECGFDVAPREASDRAESVLEAAYAEAYVGRLTPVDRLTPSLAAAVEREGWPADWLVRGLTPEQAGRVQAIDLYGGDPFKIHLRVGLGQDPHKVSYRLVCEGERWLIDDAASGETDWINPPPDWLRGFETRIADPMQAEWPDDMVAHGEALVRAMHVQVRNTPWSPQTGSEPDLGWFSHDLQRQMAASIALKRPRNPDGWPGLDLWLWPIENMVIEPVGQEIGDEFGNGTHLYYRVDFVGSLDLPRLYVVGVDFGRWIIRDVCLYPGARSLAQALNTPRPGEAYQWVQPAGYVTCPDQP